MAFGVKTIQKALESFTKVKERLEAGIVQTTSVLRENEQQITDLESENVDLLASIGAARRAVAGIDRLLNGE